MEGSIFRILIDVHHLPVSLDAVFPFPLFLQYVKLCFEFW